MSQSVPHRTRLHGKILAIASFHAPPPPRPCYVSRHSTPAPFEPLPTCPSWFPSSVTIFGQLSMGYSSISIFFNHMHLLFTVYSATRLSKATSHKNNIMILLFFSAFISKSNAFCISCEYLPSIRILIKDKQTDMNIIVPLLAFMIANNIQTT